MLSSNSSENTFETTLNIRNLIDQSLIVVESVKDHNNNNNDQLLHQSVKIDPNSSAQFRMRAAKLSIHELLAFSQSDSIESALLHLMNERLRNLAVRASSETAVPIRLGNCEPFVRSRNVLFKYPISLNGSLASSAASQSDDMSICTLFICASKSEETIGEKLMDGSKQLAKCRFTLRLKLNSKQMSLLNAFTWSLDLPSFLASQSRHLVAKEIDLVLRREAMGILKAPLEFELGFKSTEIFFDLKWSYNLNLSS